MEQNTDRMWWTIGLIVLGGLLISGLVMIASTNVMPQISEKANALIKQSDPDVTHTAYSWSDDGTDRFTTTKPNLNLLRETGNPLQITGDGTNNNATTNYWFDGKNLKDIVVAGMNVTLSFDWKSSAKGESGTFYPQLNAYPWDVWGVLPINVSDGSGHFSKTIPVSDNMVNSNVDGIRIRMDNVTTTLTISNMKLEIEQPKYIGTYTDKSKTDSQDPKKYTWKLNPDYHE